MPHLTLSIGTINIQNNMHIQKTLKVFLYKNRRELLPWTTYAGVLFEIYQHKPYRMQCRNHSFCVAATTTAFILRFLFTLIRKEQHTCKILHVWRFDVNYVKALITDFQIPKIHSQIISRNVCLAITNRIIKQDNWMRIISGFAMGTLKNNTQLQVHRPWTSI
jgi:hypothetical protein